jgi:predicted alpha/beta superfamily hydrolase
MKNAILGVCLLGLVGACASAAPAAPYQSHADSVPPASILQSEQFVVHSRIANADFLIQVARPMTIAPLPSGQKQPAVYVLDGTYMLGMAAPLSRLLALEGSSQPAFIVGVGFPEEDLTAYNLRRSRDLVHPVSQQSNGRQMGGGGALFERFIKEELRPLIESRYPVDPARSILAGHSLGGLFTATVLANEPTAFSGYIIGSPSLQFDPALPDRLRAAASRGEGRRVFISVGAEEGPMAPRADAVETALRADGSTFAVQRKTLAGESHVSSQGSWIGGGLRYLLPPPPKPAN